MNKSLQTKLVRLSIEASFVVFMLPSAWGMGFALLDWDLQWSASNINSSQM
jgi:hypothetical protein